MKLKSFKYLSPLLIYVGSLQAFAATGWMVWLPLFYAWIVVPLLELFIKPSSSNMSNAEEEIARTDKVYDWLLYLIVVLQYIALVQFLMVIRDEENTIDLIGKVWVMGLLCGIFGINVGHELGHRPRLPERILARTLLLTSQYMHFYVEHNKGHHKNVATHHDPNSARFGEWIYTFYFRSIIFSYINAWRIAATDVRRKARNVISIHNEMIRYSIIQLASIGTIYWILGLKVMLCYLATAAIGIFLLETVNYIEHYGLQRKMTTGGSYERAMPAHSWNSDHVIGRVMLFELSRHSDHHYLASRKYQLLRHHEDSPQMPTGYPGMMILALFPPIWFSVMNPRVQELQQR